MLRRLITLLAILSGLTAVGAPAHAGIAAGFDATLELSQQADNPSQSEAATCIQRQQTPRVARGNSPVRTWPATPRRAVPTVMLGVDRARE